MKWCFYTHPKLAPEGWQPNKEVEEKVAKKKAADKKKGDDKNKGKENKSKPDVTMIHHHHAFSSALNMNALPEVFKGITDLMPFVKALIDSKVTINKAITPSSPWKIIVDFRATGHIFSNRSYIFNFKPISSYVETGSDELLQCPGRSKVKIDLEGLNDNIDVVMEDII